MYCLGQELKARVIKIDEKVESIFVKIASRPTAGEVEAKLSHQHGEEDFEKAHEVMKLSDEKISDLYQKLGDSKKAAGVKLVAKGRKDKSHSCSIGG